jgi:heme-degrading monooxygenase HmoA
VRTTGPDWGHVIIWEFHVRQGHETRFEQVYGPDGEWTQIFKSDAGYLGTELNRDYTNPRRYITLDFWSSRAAYLQFREAKSAEYKAMDDRTEVLAEREVELGSFERILPQK